MRKYAASPIENSVTKDERPSYVHKGGRIQYYKTILSSSNLKFWLAMVVSRVCETDTRYSFPEENIMNVENRYDDKDLQKMIRIIYFSIYINVVMQTGDSHHANKNYPLTE